MSTARLNVPPVLVLSILAALLAPACSEDDAPLRAARVTSANELIGGPSAKGDLGDFILENDNVRVIISDHEPTFAGGIFGGTLLDADLRRTESAHAYGNGRDAFAETFPTLNLIVVDPAADVRRVVTRDGGFDVELVTGGVSVLSDGSDGVEASVRVTGSGGYIFDIFKFLDLSFLRGFASEPLPLETLVPAEYLGLLQAFGLEEAYIPAAAAALPELLALLAGPLNLPPDVVEAVGDLRIELFRLLGRLKFDFDFQTDYIVRPGQPWVTVRTTVRLAPPPADRVRAHCPDLDCDLNCGDEGYVMQEVLVGCEPEELCKLPLAGMPGTQDALFCPVCECAATQAMPVLTESRSIFNDILGNDLANWGDPLWRSALVAGDFLFFGGETNVFAPGLGFDENRKIFENMWQGVGTIGNPLVFDWVAAVADDVSYAVVTVNEDRRTDEAWSECPEYRFALGWVDGERFDEVRAVLVDELGLAPAVAESGLQGLLVDRTPFPLPGETPLTTATLSAGSLPELRQAALATARGAELAAAFGATARVDVLPRADCQAARLLVPLFTTSATAVMTHEFQGGLEEAVEGEVRDPARVFEYERYFVIGGGDVGSLLGPVLELRGEPHGDVRGHVFEAESLRPVRHASVFALQDPRPTLDALAADDELWAAALLAQVPALPPVDDLTYDAVVATNQALFGHRGFVSMMQTDLGDDPVWDGDYSGPLPPGDYLLFAKTDTRPVSRPAAITVAVGQRETAHLMLDAPARVTYEVQDATGSLTPAKLSFVRLSEITGEPLTWDSGNRVELGEHRSDAGVRDLVLTPEGKGELIIEPGLYDIWASRGLEYDVDVKRRVRLKPAETRSLAFTIRRSVDTEGWISGDFHMHARPSVDAGLPLDDRVISNVVEGLEFVTATDHDHLIDYRPFINELGLERFLGFQAGVETSTLEFGHYNVYPLDYDDRIAGTHDPPPWQKSRLGEVFREMRARGLGGPEETIVQVNHPRDGFMGMFSQTGVNGLSLERETPGLETCNPMTVDIPCDFEAMEIMNEKRFELIRTPTVDEVTWFNRCLVEIVEARQRDRFPVSSAGDDAVCAAVQREPAGCASVDSDLAAAVAAGGEDDVTRLRILEGHCRWRAEFRAELERCVAPDGADEGELSLLDCKRVAIEALKLLSVRHMLEREPAEQAALQFFRAHPDWAPACDAATLEAGCEPLLAEGGDEDDFAAGCDGCVCETCLCGDDDQAGVMPECCVAPGEAFGEDGDGVGTGWTAACASACRDTCGACDAGTAPCAGRVEILDDWMTMLNQGMSVTAMGNSDSHDLLYEGGLPRNWLRSDTDQPGNLDLRAVNDAIRDGQVVISSGPFVEVTLNGAPIGDTIVPPADEPLAMKLRVQTPRWFGVDRVEVYRNGELEKLLFVDAPSEEVIDLDTTLLLDRPTEDSWYAVVTYGLESDRLLAPVYHGVPYGHILLPTVISLATEQLLAPFSDLLDAASGFVDLAALLGADERPDSFPVLPFALTNPIWVDVDGIPGFDAPDAPDWDGDGRPDLPAFCSQPCALVTDDDGMVLEAQSTCPRGQVCVDDGSGTGASAGRCVVPISVHCTDGDWANDLSLAEAPSTGSAAATAAALTADSTGREAAASLAPADEGLDHRSRLSRQLQRRIELRLRAAPGARRHMPARGVTR